MADGEVTKIFLGHLAGHQELSATDGLLVEVLAIAELFVQSSFTMEAKILGVFLINLGRWVISPVSIDAAKRWFAFSRFEWRLPHFRFQSHLKVERAQVLVDPAGGPDQRLVRLHHAIQLKVAQVMKCEKRSQALDGEKVLIEIFLVFVQIIDVIIILIIRDMSFKLDRPEQIEIERVSLLV